MGVERISPAYSAEISSSGNPIRFVKCDRTSEMLLTS